MDVELEVPAAVRKYSAPQLFSERTFKVSANRTNRSKTRVFLLRVDQSLHLQHSILEFDSSSDIFSAKFLIIQTRWLGFLKTCLIRDHISTPI